MRVRQRRCPLCLKEFKSSNEGKAARKANGGTWRRFSSWPDWSVSTSGSRLCKSHLLIHKRKLGQTYSDRSTALLALGFSSYPEYLRSGLWLEIREKILILSNYCCEFCGQIAGEVHHAKYSVEVLRGDDLRWLHAVCRKCHERGEYFASGDKSLPLQATRRMAGLYQLASSSGP